MKKIVLTIMAVAAMAACSKSGVQYETSGEIGFAPFTGNITKASGMSGELDPNQKLGIYAFWNKTVDLENKNSVTVPQNGYAAYSDDYLVNALFASKSGSWGGSPTGYPWPVNGALVFAGYTTPGDAVLTNDSAVKYDLVTDIMTFTNYSNATEFDLCWFGRTSNSYNNRTTGAAIDVKLAHALSWISIAVYGEGTSVGWTINSIEWKVPTAGTAECVGNSATWTVLTYPAVDVAATNILTADHTISGPKGEGDKKIGTTITDNLVIPSTPVDVKVTYTFKVNGVAKQDSKIVSLKLNDGNSQTWLSGVHYTYTLAFKANEILVAPSYNTWADGGNDTVIVE